MHWKGGHRKACTKLSLVFTLLSYIAHPIIHTLPKGLLNVRLPWYPFSRWLLGCREWHWGETPRAMFHACAPCLEQSPPAFLPFPISYSKPTFPCNEIQQPIVCSVIIPSSDSFPPIPRSTKRLSHVGFLRHPQVTARDLDWLVSVSHLPWTQGFVHEWILDPGEATQSIPWNWIGRYWEGEVVILLRLLS